MALAVALKILDPRLPGWGFPHYGSSLAAGLDLHACIDEPLPSGESALGGVYADPPAAPRHWYRSL